VGDEHGPSLLAIVFLGADAIASYDALFCQGYGIAAPLAVLIEDYGFGGQYQGGSFGRRGLLEQIAVQCAVMPCWLLVAENSDPWDGFVRVAGVGGDPGRMHGRLLYLHERFIKAGVG